jgi:hypothetical protein
MQWTTRKTTPLGTHYVKRGKWHGLPYVISATSARGMSRTGWFVLVLALLLLVVVALVEEFLL